MLNQILFAFEQYRLLIIFIDFQQREQTALIVDIGQSRRITDKCAGNPAHSNPRQASQYRLGRNNSCGSKPAAAALQEIQGFGRRLFFGLVVHVEHIAGAYDVALADFNRRRMQHWPGRFGGGAGKYTLAAGHGGFIAGGAVGFTGLKDESGLAVEAYVFGDGFGAAQVGEEGEGDGVV